MVSSMFLYKPLLNDWLATSEACLCFMRMETELVTICMHMMRWCSAGPKMCSRCIILLRAWDPIVWPPMGPNYHISQYAA